MPVVARTVLHITQPSDAGVARWVVDHARRQAAAGWNVHVAGPPEGWLATALTDLDVSVHPWTARREPHRGVGGESRRLRSIVTAVGPDLVHLHSAKAGLDGRLVLRGRRATVFSPHAWSFDAVAGPLAAAALRWERVAARWSDRVLTVSTAERDRGLAAGVRAGYATVPNGVDLSLHRSVSAAERAGARRELGLDPEAALAVCVGRLSRQKGQDLLLDAWPAARAAAPDGMLALVGDGPDAAALRERAGEGVVLAGATADPRRWYAAASLVVAPSRWEGMAFVPLEAMAAGRSVVAFDVTGMREAVPPEAGRLVPAGDTAALANALAERLLDPGRADGEGRAGRDHVERVHDVDALAGRVLALYDDVLARRAATRATGDGSSR
jgi:glycosyltransferase involved in cell wall biosynthesis